MEKIYGRTTTIQEDKVSGFCPGCMHSTVIKLIGEVLDEMKLVKAPVTELALEMGNAKVLNVIMLGVYVGYTEVIDPAIVWQTIEHKLSSKPKLLPLNKQAFEKGLELGRAQKQ